MGSKEIAVKFYGLFAQGDLPAVLAMLHPEVSWHEAEGSPYNPNREGWVGPDAVVANLFANMEDDWLEFTVNPDQFHEAGPVVTVEGRYFAVHRGTGKELDSQYCHVITVEDGKITRFQQYVDTAQMQEVMDTRVSSAS